MSNRCLYDRFSHNGYNSFHCWYYREGGRVLQLKEIRLLAEDCASERYSEFHSEDRQRYSYGIIAELSSDSKEGDLRKRQTQTMISLADDVKRFRSVRRSLNVARDIIAKGEEYTPPFCNCPFTAMSLKHNHVFNRFFDLKVIELVFLNRRQFDLFD